MNCDNCNIPIEPGEEREHLGRTLCEDCCIDVLSPLKTCDPWAVHSAKSHEQHNKDSGILTPLQEEILRQLKRNGAMEPSDLLRKVDSNLQLKDLEREFAALRHMEKVRGEKKGQTVVWRLW